MLADVATADIVFIGILGEMVTLDDDVDKTGGVCAANIFSLFSDSVACAITFLAT